MRCVPKLLLSLVLLTACQTDPVTGKSYYSPLGNDFASQDKWIRSNFITQLQIANDGGLLPEPAIDAACRRIFDQVAASVPEDHRRGFSYSFFLTASPEINAYTYGGGRVHCHLGILVRCRDAAEFAGLMAHEIGHNSHDHIGQSMGRSNVAGAFASLGGIAGQPGRDLFASLGGIVLVQYTRSQEREADDRAVDYVETAGYDATGLARFFEKMDADFGGGGAQFFQTHPSPGSRVEDIEKRARADGSTPERKADPRFDKAVARAREILPYYAALYAAMESEDHDQLLKAATEGTVALPGHAQFHFWRGVILEGRKEHAQAIPEFRRASSLDSTNVILPLVHSSVEYMHGNWREAGWAANQVIRILPAIPGAFLIRGVASVKLGEKERGYADLDLVMKNVPEKEHPKVLETIHKQVPDYTYPR